MAEGENEGDAGLANPPDSLPPDATTVIINEPPAAMLINNRFLVVKQLGRGGFGRTYRAVDTQDGNRPVVVKVLLEQGNEKMRAWAERHFREESRALARIDHPGIVKLVDFGNTPDGAPYLAMEFVEGCILHSEIRPEMGIGDFGRVASIISQLGEAISAANDNGIYHRDLKPDNIMLCDSGDSSVEQVKVIDFGISTVKESLDETTRATMLVGSIRYMAPEQLRGKPSASSDIYSLGVIAYEMITGRTPFNLDMNPPVIAATKLAEMQRVGVRVLPSDLRPSLPARADKVILKALEYNPANRYRRADEFGRELAEALLDRPHNGEMDAVDSRAPQSRILAPPLVERKRNRWPAIAAIGLLAATILGFGWWIFNRDSASDKDAANLPVQAQQQTRTLSYWGEVQTYKDKKPVGEATRFTGVPGQLYFKKEDYLRLFFKGSSDGHLYVILEEPAALNREATYNILFPSPKINNNSSMVQADRQIATSEYYFYGNPGVEKVWIIWSASQYAELEDAIRRWANEQNEGEIKDARQAQAIRQLLENNSAANSQVEPDLEARQMNLRTTNDVLVYQLSLDHR